VKYDETVGMGTWVTVFQGAEVNCVVCQHDTIEITFDGYPEFNLSIDAEALEQAIPRFTAALHKLRARKATQDQPK
jgi:hypothetical protein